MAHILLYTVRYGGTIREVQPTDPTFQNPDLVGRGADPARLTPGNFSIESQVSWAREARAAATEWRVRRRMTTRRC